MTVLQCELYRLRLSEMKEVVSDRECDGSILSCCHRNPHGHKRITKKEEEDSDEDSN